MAPTPDEASSGKAVNDETNANTGKSAAAAAAAQESSVKITPAEEAQQSPSGQQSENENLKCTPPTLPSSSSSEDMYDLFAPPVSSASGRRTRPNMTVVTAADSVLTGSDGDDDGVVLPPFRGMVSFGSLVQSIIFEMLIA
jgi:hypothetical protein